MNLNLSYFRILPNKTDLIWIVPLKKEEFKIKPAKRMNCKEAWQCLHDQLRHLISPSLLPAEALVHSQYITYFKELSLNNFWWNFGDKAKKFSSLYNKTFLKIAPLWVEIFWLIVIVCLGVNAKEVKENKNLIFNPWGWESGVATVWVLVREFTAFFLHARFYIVHLLCSMLCSIYCVQYLMSTLHSGFISYYIFKKSTFEKTNRNTLISLWNRHTKQLSNLESPKKLTFEILLKVKVTMTLFQYTS